MRFARRLLIAVATALAIPAATSAQEPVSLERTLVRAAPDVIKFCKEKGFKNVGVLKFLVHKEGDKEGNKYKDEKGNPKASDSAGTLNRTIARQLEMGLILANDPKEPLGILDNASDIAAKTPGANHTTKDGRTKLFEAKYPLAWGKETVTPDIFITGLVGVSDDLKTLKVQLVFFDKSAEKLNVLGAPLVAKNDPRKLVEMNENFTRGAFDDGSVETKTDPKEKAKQEEKVLEKAVEVKTETAKNPVQNTESPVKLEILYDGKVVPIEVKDGKAFAPEALEGQKVTLRLVRTAAAKGTVGCVVKVNGENTLFREKQPDLSCRKWLLIGKEQEDVTISGYQKSETVFEEFRVLSRAESKARELDYGADVGTITLTVFGEQKGKPPAGDLTDESQNTKVLERAKAPEKKPDNFNALTAQLLEDASTRGSGDGGLIAQGAEKKGNINIVKFVSDPTPLMSLTVTYYKK